MEFLSNNAFGFNIFTEEVEKIIASINGHTKQEDLETLKKFIANFKMKTEDFNRENRKLNIGVIGQVKAGKSSFLNALLFDGKEILPKAATPKTATLTKLEYSEKNSIEIEYYSKDEWNAIENNSKINSESEIYSAARELVKMIEKNGIDPYLLLEKGKETKEFTEYDELLLGLNDYVGEDGKYTPVVKSVTLYLNKKEFKGLSIVDTPGLNDPIVSRTIRTKEFIELCDVVFFLSRSGRFLDQTDWTLLSSQLPQKGVKKLVLIASQFDNGIRDVDFDEDAEDDDNSASNVTDACKLVRKILKKDAKDKVAQYIEELNSRQQQFGQCSNALIEVIKQCEKPIMFSSMAYNMVNKKALMYTDDENSLACFLQPYSKDLQADLKIIGNADEVKTVFSTVVKEKEKILCEKASSFIPNAKEELKNILTKFLEKTTKRINILESNDQAQLLEKKATIEKQMSSIKADIASVFGELNTKIETEKTRAIPQLRELSKDSLSIREHTGTRMKQGYREVDDYVFFGLIPWGSHEEPYTYPETYQYCLAADAVELLHKYTLDASTQIENVFTNAINLKDIKKMLLDVIMKNFDMGSEKFDVSFFRTVVEETVNNIEYPVFKIDIGEDVNSITVHFSEEITSAKEKTNLATMLGAAVLSVNNKLIEEFSNKVRILKKEMTDSCNAVQKNLLNDITVEFKLLLEECENKNKEIAGYRDYKEILEKEIENLN